MNPKNQFASRPGISELAWCSVVSAFLTWLFRIRTEILDFNHVVWLEKGDFHAYHYMAAHPIFSFHMAPYCWRVLNPWLVQLLPFSLEINFQLITWFSIWLCGILIYLWIRLQQYTPSMAFSGLLFYYSMGWVVKYNLFNFWMCDPLSYVWISVCLIAIITNKDLLFAIALMLGVTTRESVIFIAPLFYTLKTSRLFDRRLLIRTLVLVAPALLALMLIRKVIPAMNQDPSYVLSLKSWLYYPDYQPTPYDPRLLVSDFVKRRLHHFSLESLHTWSTYAYGTVLTLLAFAGAVRNRTSVLRYSPFIIMGYAQLLLAANTERLLVIIYPVVIVWAIDALQRALNHFRIKTAYAIPLPIMLIAVNLLNPREICASIKVQLAVLLIYAIALRLTLKWKKAGSLTSCGQ